MSSLNLFKAITESKLILYTEPSAAELRASSRKRMENKRAHANEPREGAEEGKRSLTSDCLPYRFLFALPQQGSLTSMSDWTSSLKTC